MLNFLWFMVKSNVRTNVRTNKGVHLFVIPETQHNHIFFPDVDKEEALERFKEFQNNPNPLDYFLFECEGRKPTKLLEIMYHGQLYVGFLNQKNMCFFDYLPDKIVQGLVEDWNKSK